MLKSSITSRYIKPEKTRLCQGDILRDISVYIDLPIPSSAEGELQTYDLPYCVVMTQDCDLTWDHHTRNPEQIEPPVNTNSNADDDKLVPTILVCPAYQSDFFYTGDHVKGRKMRVFNRGDKEKLQKNEENNRYHFLDGDTSLQIPDLVLDFKHFYTLPTELLYPQLPSAYLATINELFRERLSQRFANYLSRFGLPDIIK